MTASGQLSETLNVYFHLSAIQESRAAQLAYRLAKSPLLTAEERDFCRDVIGPEEVAHLRIDRELASHFGPARRPDVWIAHRARDWPDLGKLFSLHKGERYFVRYVHRLRRLLGWILPEAVALAERIDREERGHVAFGRRVLGRLRAEGRVTPEAVRAYGRTPRDHERRVMIRAFCRVEHDAALALGFEPPPEAVRALARSDVVGQMSVSEVARRLAE